MNTTLDDLKKTLEGVQKTLDDIDMWLAQTKIDLKHTIECTDELLEGAEE